MYINARIDQQTVWLSGICVTMQLSNKSKVKLAGNYKTLVLSKMLLSKVVFLPEVCDKGSVLLSVPREPGVCIIVVELFCIFLANSNWVSSQVTSSVSHKDLWSSTRTTIVVGYIPYNGQIIYERRIIYLREELTKACWMIALMASQAIIEPGLYPA